MINVVRMLCTVLADTVCCGRLLCVGNAVFGFLAAVVVFTTCVLGNNNCFLVHSRYDQNVLPFQPKSERAESVKRK